MPRGRTCKWAEWRPAQGTREHMRRLEEQHIRSPGQCPLNTRILVLSLFSGHKFSSSKPCCLFQRSLPVVSAFVTTFKLAAVVVGRCPETKYRGIISNCFINLLLQVQHLSVCCLKNKWLLARCSVNQAHQTGQVSSPKWPPEDNAYSL